MASPKRHSTDVMKRVRTGAGDMNCVRGSLEDLRCLTQEENAETGTLQSRIEEQSSLICLLKQRADERLLRCQALQKTKTELEGLAAERQRDLDLERKKSKMFEQRFNELATNHQDMIAFKDDYKRQNVQLRQQNQQLQSENESLCSQKLQEKEALVHRLTEEVKLLKEKLKNTENEHQERIAVLRSKVKEQTTQREVKEASLLGELHDTQRLLKDAAGRCKGLKLQLQKAGEDRDLKELKVKEDATNLTKDRDKFLNLSIERGKIIQEKQEEMERLETKWKAERKARTRAEDRFEEEAAAVKVNLKVGDLQRALAESIAKYKKLEKDFEAYKEHSTNLLTQEKELNARLRHMTG
ncbi:coiled-coil domain-containing protein 89 [Lampris incognitus]|uniref:coiled-coil domain-containing protein 89 n=1 Tax=Lampris incognitus TaxID=2546036 RepID=UPI0024B588F7|nr:coiled-coil domain-containing protein 89 [Lampris incognitus]